MVATLWQCQPPEPNHRGGVARKYACADGPPRQSRDRLPALADRGQPRWASCLGMRRNGAPHCQSHRRELPVGAQVGHRLGGPAVAGRHCFRLPRGATTPDRRTDCRRQRSGHWHRRPGTLAAIRIQHGGAPDVGGRGVGGVDAVDLADTQSGSLHRRVDSGHGCHPVLQRAERAKTSRAKTSRTGKPPFAATRKRNIGDGPTCHCRACRGSGPQQPARRRTARHPRSWTRSARCRIGGTRPTRQSGGTGARRTTLPRRTATPTEARTSQRSARQHFAP